MKLTSGQGTPLIPENEIVNVTVANVEYREFEWENETVRKLRWDFIVNEPGDWEGKIIFGDTSTIFTAHPNCKAYNWAVALTGKQYDDGEQLDTDDLIGLPGRIIVSHKADKQGQLWMRAREVLPAGRGVTGSEAPF